MLDGVPTRERYERFCGHFVESRNPDQSFRLAFVVDPRMTKDWVHQQARALLRDPDVMARVQELRDTAAAATLVSVRDLMQDLHDIATADPNELISVAVDCCRYCYGIDHRFQWKDEAEWAVACDEVLARPPVKDRAPPPLPDMAGGFGYLPTHEPALTCPSCYGRGRVHVVAHDTRRLSPSARKLYKGAKQKGDGSLEILMHDQHAARESLGRILGAFKDGIPVTPVVPIGTPIPATATPAEAAKSYLRLVSTDGIKVA